MRSAIAARLLRREAFQLVEQLELEQFLVRVLLDLGALARHLGFVDLALGLRGEVGARAHRQRARQRAGEPRGEHDFAAARVAGHARDDAEHRAEAVVHAVDRVADPAGAAHVPALAAQDGVERRPWPTAIGPPARPRSIDRVIRFLGFRLLGDLPIGRIASGAPGAGRIRPRRGSPPAPGDAAPRTDRRSAGTTRGRVPRRADRAGARWRPRCARPTAPRGAPPGRRAGAGCRGASGRVRARRGAGKWRPPRPRGATSSRRSAA